MKAESVRLWEGYKSAHGLKCGQDRVSSYLPSKEAVQLVQQQLVVIVRLRRLAVPIAVVLVSVCSFCALASRSSAQRLVCSV